MTKEIDLSNFQETSDALIEAAHRVIAAERKVVDLEATIAEKDAEIERLQSGVVCGDCDGSGWLENRVDGRHPCTCMTEAEPYQLIEQKVIEQQAHIERLKGFISKLPKLMCECGKIFEEDSLADEVLAIPTSTEALRLHDAELVERIAAMEECKVYGLTPSFMRDTADQIRKGT